MSELWQQCFIENGWAIENLGPWEAVNSPSFGGAELSFAIPDLASDPLENAVMIRRITSEKKKLFGKKAETTSYNIDPMGDGDLIVDYLSEIGRPITKEQILQFLEEHTMALFQEI